MYYILYIILKIRFKKNKLFNGKKKFYVINFVEG